MSVKSMLTGLVLVMGAPTIVAEWRPAGTLASIPVIENCVLTGGDIAVARPGPVIYYCQAQATAANKRWPGVGHFYYVHEFGHHALNTSDESQADCWAAQQLSAVDDGEFYLRAAIKHFSDRGLEHHPAYGTAIGRAERIRQCANLPDVAAPQYGRSCCTQAGKCGPFFNQPALPVGSACSCQYGNPYASGTVCK